MLKMLIQFIGLGLVLYIVDQMTGLLNLSTDHYSAGLLALLTLPFILPHIN